MSKCNKFLILGCQRSGTTLLGMALQAHPEIELIEENNPHFHTQAEITKEINLKAIEEYMPSECKLVGFKAPRDTHRAESIIRAIPGIRIIWISREIHQVVASMVSLRLGMNNLWATDYAPKEIMKYLNAEKNDSVISELYQWATALADNRNRAIALATVCWISKQRSELEACALWPDLIHRVTYNELVISSRNTLSLILEFLGTSWNPAVLDHSSSLSGNRPGGTTTNRDMDTNSINKWKAVLSSDERHLIDVIIGDYISANSYH